MSATLIAVLGVFLACGYYIRIWSRSDDPTMRLFGIAEAVMDSVRAMLIGMVFASSFVVASLVVKYAAAPPTTAPPELIWKAIGISFWATWITSTILTFAYDSMKASGLDARIGQAIRERSR